MWSALFLHINIKIWLLHSLHLQYLMIIAAFFLNVHLRHGAGQVYRITRSLQGGYLELSRQVLNCLLTTLSLPKVNTQGNVEQLAGLTSSFKRLLPKSLAPCWYSQQLFMSDSPLPPKKQPYVHTLGSQGVKESIDARREKNQVKTQAFTKYQD